MKVNRSRFGSQTSDNMDRWKGRSGKSQRGERVRRESASRKKIKVRAKVEKSPRAVFSQGSTVEPIFQFHLQLFWPFLGSFLGQSKETKRVKMGKRAQQNIPLQFRTLCSLCSTLKTETNMLVVSILDLEVATRRHVQHFGFRASHFPWLVLGLLWVCLESRGWFRVHLGSAWG